MFVRSLLIAGIAGGSLVAGTSALAQYLPMGRIMNAIQPPPAGGQAQPAPAQGNRAVRPGGAAGARSKTAPPPRQYDRVPSRNPSYIGQRSEENG